MNIVRSSRLRIATVLVLGILLTAVTGAADSTQPSAVRVAEALREDLRLHARLPASFRVLLDRADREGSLLRLWYSGREGTSSSALRPIACYEYDLRLRRVVRRDLTSFTRSFPRLALGLIESTSIQTPNQPLREGQRPGGLTIRGVLRNLPGYILETPNFTSRFRIWAEAGGAVVATDTQLFGTTVYELYGVPVTAGRITIKAAIRGYDLVTLHPGVSLNQAQPIGTIGGIDVDFHQMRPITRDVRILVRSNGGGEDASFPPGARARVYCKETGHSAETVSQNYYGEAWLNDVPTGWPLNFHAVNVNSGWLSGSLGPITIPENGGSAFTETITLE